jgi:hypothetical protein
MIRRSTKNKVAAPENDIDIVGVPDAVRHHCYRPAR